MRNSHVARVVLGTLITFSLSSFATSNKTLNAFDNDFKLQAKIIRTTYGVPHIYADNIESLSFGMGYAFAEDNVCLLADQTVRFRSKRSFYFGPDQVPGSGDSQNIISDFAYKAFNIQEQAEQHFDQLSDASKSRMQGYAAGYNKYLKETGIDNIDPSCAGQAWVKPITGKDILANTLAIALLPGIAQFTEQVFFANPGVKDEYLPVPSSSANNNDAKIPSIPSTYITATETLKGITQLSHKKIGIPTLNPNHLGSNGWGLGRQKTENGRGALLANPHFPHTGNLRFWQSHLVIPGKLDVMGGSLAGSPGIISIGFNRHIAWTHTFSTAEHFIAYRLELDPTDKTRYLYDGQSIAMKKRTLTIDVAVAPGVVIPFKKDIYESRFGLIVETPPEFKLLTWDDSQAFTIKDANTLNLDVIDHWAAINQATNLQEFKQTFKDFDGVIFNNTMYSDKKGNAFYIDDSTVPFLNDTANALLKTDPIIIATREAAGFHILPGNTSIFDFQSSVPFEQAPKLLRNDYVQNSNDSYWSTNLDAPLEGFSRLYGKERSELTLRTRMGLQLLKDGAGPNGKFNLQELENSLLNNRVYLNELLVDDLLIRCEAQGSVPIVIADGTPVDISEACLALYQWNGVMNSDSVGALVLREFAHKFDTKKHLIVPFDFTDPANTPNTLNTAEIDSDKGNDSVLSAFASAVVNIQRSGLSPFAELGDVQFVEKSTYDGKPSGNRLPWPGAFTVEGGFNVFRPELINNGTLLPSHRYPPIIDVDNNQAVTSGLAKEGYHINYGSSWMFVMQFTRNGPKARGLLTYSQSRNTLSNSFNDQSQLYSEEKRLRPLLFNAWEIKDQTISHKKIELVKEGREEYIHEQWRKFWKWILHWIFSNK